MSSLAKLSIRGVRAFSPEDEEQIVEFYFPFTIIVGQNGCGKTTIIECLKYAITGGLPPGSKAGQAFVHDPRQSGSKQSKATVKLRFNTRTGQPTVVIRSMELTRNKTTLSFKQLDGVIRTSDAVTGTRSNLSHKCSELDSTLPALLGISKAILDNVLFCHQEEASWPLQEGAVLKKKFDDIFDSTRYTKALDAFRKKEKDLLSTCKDIKITLAGLDSTKTAVEGYRRELREQKEAEEDLANARINVGKEIETTEKDIDYYEGIVDKIDDIQTELSKMQGMVDQHKAALDRQQKMVDIDMSGTHTLDDLSIMLADYDNSVGRETAKQELVESEIQELNDKIDSLHKSEMDLKSTLGKLESEKETYEQHLRQRLVLMEGIASSYNFSLLEYTQSQQINTSFRQSLTAGSQSVDTEQLVEISQEDMQNFFRKAEDLKSNLESDLKKHKHRVQRDEDVLQKDLLDLGGKLGALEKDKEELLKQKREGREEMNQLNKDISSSSRLRRGEVEEAKKNAERLANERDEANSDPRLQNIEIEIRQIEDKWEELKRKQTDIKVELDALQESAEAHTAIATLDEELTREYETLEESVKDYSSLLCRFNLQDLEKLPKMSGDGQAVVDAVEQMGIEIRDKLNDAQDRLGMATSAYNKQESAFAEKSWALRTIRQNLQVLEQQKNVSEGAVVKVRAVVEKLREDNPGVLLNENDPTALRKLIDEKIEDINDSLASTDPSVIKSVMKRLLKLANSNNPVCPCCEQKLDTPEKLRTYSDRGKLLWSDNSPLLSDLAEERVAAKSEYQSWRLTIDKHSSAIQNYVDLQSELKARESDNQSLDGEVNLLSHILAQLKDEMEDLRAEAVDLEELAKASDRWKDTSLRIGQKAMTIHSKRKDLAILNRSSANVRDRRTVDREYTAVTEEIDRLSSKKTGLNHEATKLNQLISQTAQQAASAESRAKEKATKFADSERAMNRKNEILELQKNLAEREKQVDRDIPSLSMRVKERESEKQRLRQEGSSEESKLHRAIQEFDTSLQHLGTITYQIETYSNSNKAEEHQRILSTLDNYADHIKDLKEKVSASQLILDNLRNIYNNKERRKRQLQYNVQIIEEKNKLAALHEQMRDKKRAMKSIEHYATARDELLQARERKAKLLETKNLSQGRYSEIRDRIRSLTVRLNQPEYRDVDKKHRKATIEYETTHIAAADLKKYQQALDSALLQFHAKKLAEINKSIRELWLMTYKGEDITNIVIQSGQEPGARAQKSYNYRVVMTKGSTELDMRGRCSAGQRVLAVRWLVSGVIG
ncbi:hypothetical protein MPSEU_000573900 [Mayamaea pseudoterrestris]|nr:hypothetical protein MPSEU_000573900 [Mayamaea pseudoterrestris]